MFRNIFLLLVLAVHFVVYAIELGIQRDSSLFSDNLKISQWNSIAHFQNNIDDGTLRALGQAAFQEFDANCDSLAIPKKRRPTVMTAMAVGNSVYFASSAKSGDVPFVYTARAQDGGTGGTKPNVPSMLAKALTDCSTNTNPQHKNNANCGEIMTAMMWLKSNPGQDLSTSGARILSYKRTGYIAACGDTGAWGCSSTMSALGVGMVPDGNLADVTNLNPVKTENFDLIQCFSA